MNEQPAVDVTFEKPWGRLIAGPRCRMERFIAPGGEHGFEIHVTMPSFDGDQDVIVGRVSLDALVRYLGPSCGLLPADYEFEGPSAKPRVDGPFCVGGPYDGRRIPREAYPSGHIRVPVKHPFELAQFHPGTEYSPDFTLPDVGRYDLVPFSGGNGTPESVAVGRELWWWTPPQPRKARR